MSSLVITIGDVVISASPGATDLGLISWADPVAINVNEYAPTVPYLNGETALSFRRPNTLANATIAPFGAANESEAEALIAALTDEISRLGYTLMRERNGVTKTYRCDAGSLTPNGATTKLTVDRPHVAVWDLSIPCSPTLVA